MDQFFYFICCAVLLGFVDFCVQGRCMRRRDQRELVPLDPEIDRTLRERTRALRQQQLAEARFNPLFEDEMEDRVLNQNQPPINHPPGNNNGNDRNGHEVNQEQQGEGDRTTTMMEEFHPYNMATQHSAIVVPNQAINFELKPQLLHMVRQEAFRGTPLCDPHLHLMNYNQLCGSINAVGAQLDGVKLKLFPFSLRDQALEWYYSLPQNSIHSWSEMTDQFLLEFFPLSSVRKVQDDIDHFKQLEMESLHEALKRFKALMKKCPNTDRPPTDKFFLGLNWATMKEVNSASGGAFLDLDRHVAWRLVEKMAKSDRQLPQRGHQGSVAAVSESSDLSGKMDTMLQHIAALAMNKGPTSSSSEQYSEDVEDAKFVGERGYYQRNNNPSHQRNNNNNQRYVPPNQRNNYMSYGANNTNYLVPPPGFAEAHDCKPDLPPAQNQGGYRNQGHQTVSQDVIDRMNRTDNRLGQGEKQMQEMQAALHDMNKSMIEMQKHMGQMAGFMNQNQSGAFPSDTV